MQRIVFYSWQSDLPNATNRGFIQKALEGAAAKIAKDQTVEVTPVIDRDTNGVSGSPDIATTILAKIAAADIFVADISIINRGSSGRETPNPNVLIELGYALRVLNFERIVLTFNLAYGKIGSLPFDLRGRRVMTYTLTENSNERSEERKRLEKHLGGALRAAIEHIPVHEEAPLALPSINAIELDKPNKIVLLRRDLNNLIDRIHSLAPKKFSAGGDINDLLDAIHNTQEPIADFSKIVEMVVVMEDRQCLDEVHRWFGKILEKYQSPEGYQGSYRDGDYDYYRFLGHEMVVTLFAFLVKEGQWKVIWTLLKKTIPLSYLRSENGPADVTYVFASSHLSGLEEEEKNRNKITLHGFILNERHKDGGLSAVMPINDFAAADFFLFLYSEISERKSHPYAYWTAWSFIYLRTSPLYLKRAEKKDFAKTLCDIFGLTSWEELRNEIQDSITKISGRFQGGSFWAFDFRPGDIARIGTVD
ncbi:hypothetical protein EDD80_1185 [Anseongella ginsenosidimutans]|uniref:Uncharacterized protein n=1 Tax=Anseongella ginsenosidimutans TaxID=496056 RepID=A0A4V2UT86_9SPHI|nr:hypothetical protein [Anseongella ginsenosidimutans]QEC51951.1 hypothetical protein FRZ59_06130 [Anseongella ginsenosidimutans]TCS84736.1 hypothetical protein EDD80_1185 [Anseongella ginsenosidimutans]